MTSKRILITGNHHTPAIELINQLKKDKQFNWQIFYISQAFKSETHLKNTIIPLLKIKFYPLSSGKFNRRYLPETLFGIPKTIYAIFKAYSLISSIKPDITVSFGGYISVPVIVASFLQKIPSLTHEQTFTNSLSTRINSLFVNKIALSFNNSDQIQQLPSTKVVITGNLLRNQIFLNSSKKYNHLNPTLMTHPLLYITGGSQGSSFLNRIIIKLLPSLSKKFTIIHHVGKLEFESIKDITKNIKNYHPTEYINLEDIGWVLNHAALIISRSGANTCQEIVALHKNTILIPLPFSQQNEQGLNASWVKKSQPENTIVINQNKVTSKSLTKAINKLTNNPTNSLTPTLFNNYQLLNTIHDLL